MVPGMDPDRPTDPTDPSDWEHGRDDMTLLTPVEAARMIQIPITTLIRWADRHLVLCCDTGAGRRFRRRDLEAVLVRTQRRQLPPSGAEL
jgi:hypothetical protein